MSTDFRPTVRRPPTGEGSPGGYRPTGGQVARCSTSALLRPAGDDSTGRPLALAASGSDVPACGASLRRVGAGQRLDPEDILVLQACDELAQATSADRADEPAVFRRLAGPVDRRRRRGRFVGRTPRASTRRSNRCARSGALLDPVLARIPPAGFQFRDRGFGVRRPTDRACSGPAAAATPTIRLTRGKTGGCSSAPVDSAADTSTTRSMPTTRGGAGPRSGRWGGAANGAAPCRRKRRRRG